MPNTSTPNEMCFRLIYRSRSKLDGKAKENGTELSKILKSARKNNPANNLTGALVLYDDWFAQVLEGEEKTVRALLSTIEADDRHTGIRVFEEEKNVKRAFGKWAMALVSEHNEADVPLVPRKGDVAEGAAWVTTIEQEAIVDKLRNITRGYGVGS